MVPNVNNPSVHLSSLSLISSDSCSSEDEFNIKRENVTKYMLGI